MAAAAQTSTAARTFVENYYETIQSSPETAHKFYLDTSVLSRLGNDGAKISVTTKKEISDNIIASGYNNYKIEFHNVCSQKSVAGGVVVQVLGVLKTGKNSSVARNFAQTFVLSSVATVGHHVIINDILVYVDVPSPLNNEKAEISPINTTVGNKAIDNGKKPLQHSSDKTQANGKSECDHVAKDTNLGNKTQESFASILSKTASPAHEAPPVVVRVGADSNNQYDKPKKTTKPTAKVAAAAASKPVQNTTSAQGKATVVHISGLPSHTRIESIEDAIQKFGAIWLNSVKLTRKTDGWSYASAKFRSPDSAARACEAGFIRIGKRDCGIQYKKFYSKDGDNGSRSSGTADLQKDNVVRSPRGSSGSGHNVM